MASGEFEDVDVYPLHAFRFREFEGQPTLRLLQFSSGPSGQGVVHTYALAAVRKLGKECLAEAEKLEQRG